MNTRYRKLLLAFLLLILAICAAGGCGPPENGPYVQYYENGKKKLEAHCKDGHPEGLATGWYENGKKIKEVLFKDGKEVRHKQF